MPMVLFIVFYRVNFRVLDQLVDEVLYYLHNRVYLAGLMHVHIGCFGKGNNG